MPAWLHRIAGALASLAVLASCRGEPSTTVSEASPLASSSEDEIGRLDATPPTGLEFRAAGDDPSWRVEVGATEIVFFSSWSPSRTRFARTAREAVGNNIVYRGESPHPIPGTIEMSLRKQPCADRKGNVFEWKAEVEKDGKILRGCAIEGAM